MARRTRREVEAENHLLLAQLERIRDHLDDLLQDEVEGEDAVPEQGEDENEQDDGEDEDAE